MAQLLFQISEIDPSCSIGGEGAAFQQFVFEVIRPHYHHLHPYPAGGKDGGIDHLTDEPGQPRIAVECKFCGTDGVDEARKRWSVTKSNLDRNLARAEGPGQSQYRPWYRTDEPIIRYIFATSGRLENPARVDELRDEIRFFFQSLAARHAHVAHLGEIAVEVWDWNYVEGKVPAYLRFRWFPKERPAGLRLLATEAESARGFRAWLRDSTLPFYSRAHHLEIDPAPSGSDLPDERALLRTFSKDSGTLGLVLVGRGGVGKTRLALEIGHTATEDGWIVWVVRRRVKPETIDHLVTRMDANTRVLIIFDYIETHPEFTTVVQHLADIVDDTALWLRYVATCRSSYYNAIKGGDRQRVVALSAGRPGTEDWLMRYRRATVEHILSHAGISTNAKNIGACHDLPVLAAFLHWLHWRGKTEELETLLGEEDFGRWVIHRVQLSFPERRLDHSLARLIALFPLPAAGRDALTDDERELFYRLEQDGWIERADDPTAGATAWQTAHDVLADRVALEWLESIGGAALEWCTDLLRTAVRFNALPSALRSIQRLAEHLPIGESEWEAVLIAEINKVPHEWRPLKAMLLRTSLLSPPSRTRLLAALPHVFDRAELEDDFNSALGDLLRQLVETESAAALVDVERNTLFTWVRRAMPYQLGLQFLRAWAIRMDPNEFSDETLTFLKARAIHVPTQYVLCAWLYAGLPAKLVEDVVDVWCSINANKVWFSFVAEAWLKSNGNPLAIQRFLPRWFARFLSTHQASFVLSSWLTYANAPAVVQDSTIQWLDAFGTSREASYVIEAWLKHANAHGVIRNSVSDWLAAHKGDPEGSHIYKAWLGAGGDKLLVEDAIREWLVTHQSVPAAQFVYAAWLDAGGDKALVEDAIKNWLVAHKGDREAQFVYKAWLDAGGDRALVEEAIKDWVVAHKGAREARFVYKAWLDAGGDAVLVEEAIKDWVVAHKGDREAQFVYKAWLDAGGHKVLLEEAIKDWLIDHKGDREASHVYNAWLDAGGDKALVEEAIKDWLVAHQSAPEAQFVYTAWLDAGGDKTLLAEAIREWLVANKGDPGTRFVFRAWLDAGGDKALVEEAIKDWLVAHKGDFEASHIYKPWLDAGGDKALVAGAIKDWLVSHRTDREAQFVYTSWLGAGGDTVLLEEAIKDWLIAHRGESEASHLYNAWLDAGGDKALVEEAIKDWLGANKHDREASHVYKAWLDAGGSKALVEEAIKDWLVAYKNDREADFLYKAWLETGGNKDLVWEPMLEWLASYKEEEFAVYVTKFIAKQPNLPASAIGDILTWCRTFPSNGDVLWRLTQLKSNLLAMGVEEEVVLTSEVVLARLFDSPCWLTPVTRGQITTLILYLIEVSNKASGAIRDRVDTLFLSWLRHPKSFGNDPWPHVNIQRTSYLERLSVLLDSAHLNVEVDRPALERFLRWLDVWDPTRKRRALQILADLEHRYPAANLWHVVRPVNVQ